MEFLSGLFPEVLKLARKWVDDFGINSSRANSILNGLGKGLSMGNELATVVIKGKKKREMPSEPKIPASPASAAPIGLNVNFQSKFAYHGTGKRCVAIGAEMLVDGITVDTSRVGVQWVFPMNPCAWAGTHVAQLGQIFTFFEFKNLELMYIPKCPTTTAGQVTLGFVASELSPLQAFENVVNTPGSSTAAVWAPSQAKLKEHKFPNRVYDTYTAGFEADWPAVMVAAFDGVANGTVCGSLVAKYEVEFELPCWDGRVFSASPYSNTSLLAYANFGTCKTVIPNAMRTAIVNKDVIVFINNSTSWVASTVGWGDPTTGSLLGSRPLRVGDYAYLTWVGANDSGGAGFAACTFSGGAKGNICMSAAVSMGVTWYALDMLGTPGYAIINNLLNPNKALKYVNCMLEPGSQEQRDALEFIRQVRIPETPPLVLTSSEERYILTARHAALMDPENPCTQLLQQGGGSSSACPPPSPSTTAFPSISPMRVTTAERNKQAWEESVRPSQPPNAPTFEPGWRKPSV